MNEWTIDYFLKNLSDEGKRIVISAFYTKYSSRLSICTGSQHNHQAWPGGYYDHVLETLRIGRLLYLSLNAARSLEFSFDSVVTVMVLHDIEKLFPERIKTEEHDGLVPRPKAKDRVKYNILHEERLWGYLSDAEKNALDHVEGEQGYDGQHRKMKPLAAFCHACDILSARMWHDRPLAQGDTWGSRHVSENQS